MNSITHWLAGLSGPVVYAVVAGLVFVEDGFLVGVVLPGESAVVVGGVIARQGAVSVYWLCALVVVAAIAGDFIGYEIGRRSGPRIANSRFLRGRSERVDAAREMMNRRGAGAVFFGRFIAFVRTMVPGLAGLSRMPYRRFVRYNALGALLWGVGFTMLGYYAGDAYTQIEQVLGRFIAGAFVAVLLAVAVVWHMRRRRARRRREAEADAAAAAAEPAENDESDGAAEAGGVGEVGRPRLPLGGVRQLS
ncbi:DedA family protein [Kitasatospora sp. MAP5-34]|uniref:DedA family protein n=1 Tax=Kitasatospora sp. MAP5-34 TaxID=3035102 RepID=UPI0024745032|nr:DedA family protein [Kitasatospora sp. MAP5-34]MDH6578849.1 membrane-associated protein [Kitasatospora sp. MAP5-34]